MANISLKFTNRNGRFCLCATVVGTTTRHYRTVDELRNPDFKTWDKTTQRFGSRRPIDRTNNQIISDILRHYEDLMKAYDFASGKELFAFQSHNPEEPPKETVRKAPPRPTPPLQTRQAETQVASYKSEITLGKWLDEIIEEIKNPTRLKPSASYQGYLTLLHKLEAEGKLINQPVSSLGDDSFVQLIKWLGKQKGKNGKGVNFIGTMKMFAAALSRARKARLTTYRPDFPYMDYAPVHKVTDKAKDFLTNGGAIQSLTDEQYEQFVSMDLSEIKLARGVKMEYYKELYRDFSMLLYEMKSRPIDILRLHWDNIAYDEATGRFTCTYIPAKKKNYGASSKHTSKALVIQYLSPKAVEIVLKYQGKSKGGYVFPFALNQTRWNLNDPHQFHYHYYKGNHICGQINRFLHKVGQHLKVPFQLTLYAFRRTAITQAIIENKMPITMIAKVAGTSVEMIEAHYANYLHALAAY